MAKPVSSSLRELLSIEKAKYLDSRKEDGGTVEGFRERIRRQYRNSPGDFNAMVLDALMEATTHNWRQPPRKQGPDLFSIAGYTIPEFLTRPAGDDFADGETIENEDDAFEKVAAKYATVNDLYQDATIKMRKAAQSSAAAELAMKAADQARRRAKGNVSAFLKDIAD